MGIIRRHPVLTVVLIVLLSPLLVVGTVLVAQQLPACRAWRAEVEETTHGIMGYRYQGENHAQAFDRAYRHWDTTYKETRASVRAQVALEMSDRRPDLCL